MYQPCSWAYAKNEAYIKWKAVIESEYIYTTKDGHLCENIIVVKKHLYHIDIYIINYYTMENYQCIIMSNRTNILIFVINCF